MKRIYTHSDVLHCEVIDSVAEEFIKLILTPGDYNGITRMNALDWLMGDEIFKRGSGGRQGKNGLLG